MFAKRLADAKQESRVLGYEIHDKSDKVGRLSHLLRQMFPTVFMIAYVYQGNAFTIAFATLVIDLFNRVFGSFQFIPWFLDWYNARLTWEEKCTNFMSAPDMQEGIQKIVNNSDTALKMKGNFSWGFTNKDNKVNLEECVTLKNVEFEVKKGAFVCIVG